MQTFAYLEVYVRVCFFDFLLGTKIWIDENLSKVLCCSFAFFSCSRFPLFGAIILVSLLKDLRAAGLTCCNLRNQGKMIKNTDRIVFILTEHPWNWFCMYSVRSAHSIRDG